MIGHAESPDDCPTKRHSRQGASLEASSHPADDGRIPEARLSDTFQGSCDFGLVEPNADDDFARSHLKVFGNQEKGRAILTLKAPPSVPASRLRVATWDGDGG